MQGQTQISQLIERLETPELCFEKRLGIASQLRETLGEVDEHALPKNGLKENS